LRTRPSRSAPSWRSSTRTARRAAQPAARPAQPRPPPIRAAPGRAAPGRAGPGSPCRRARRHLRTAAMAMTRAATRPQPPAYQQPPAAGPPSSYQPPQPGAAQPDAQAAGYSQAYQQDTAQAAAAGLDGPANGTENPYVTPLVRKLAAEHGVDLAAVTGTGVGGRIRKQDVLDAAQAGHGLAATAPPAASAPPSAGQPAAAQPRAAAPPVTAQQAGPAGAPPF